MRVWGELLERLDLAKAFDLEWIRMKGHTCSALSKWFFMHLMAKNLLDLMLCALMTSEKVPSPFLLIRR